MGAVPTPSSVPSPVTGLQFERVAPSAVGAASSLLERTLPLVETGLSATPAVLDHGSALVERWTSPRPVQRGTAGCIAYATDGVLLAGTAIVDDTAIEGGLGAAASKVYADLFALLQGSRSPHLLRVWNYMSRINLPADGLERYRHFNVGRQQAFLAAGRSAFVGSPAACGLGTSAGPLTLHFLAGPCEPRAVENPRQVSAYDYPSTYGPRSPTFSRAALADLGGGREALFISGTASIVGHATLHAGDVRAQTFETLDNIQAVVASAVRQSALGAADAHRVDQLDMTVNVRRESDVPVVRQALVERLGADSFAVRHAVCVRADICRTDLLVEIEAHRLGGPSL